MDKVVSDLAADSGALLSVAAFGTETSGRHRSIELRFASGVLRLRCDDNTDELITEVDHHEADGDSTGDSWIQDLLGKEIEYLWELRNHRGYTDALQLRLLDVAQRGEETRQFEVIASGIEVRRVVSDGF